jgi:hypothetical protein
MAIAGDGSGLRLLGRRSCRLLESDACTVAEPKLAVDDDALTRHEPIGNDRLIFHSSVDADQTQFDGQIRFDHEHVGTILPDLDRCTGHEEGICLGAERQRDIDELSGPQPRVIVGERRLQRNCAGCNIDLIIDKCERPGDRCLRLIRNRDEHGQTLSGDCGSDLCKVPLGYREGDVDRPKLRDRHQRYGLLRRIVGFDEIATLEVDRARPARDGCPNGGVIQIHARVVDCRLIGPDCRLEHRHSGLDLFELLRRRDASRCQFGLTLDLGLRALKLSTVPFEICLALRELRHECTIVQGKEEVTLLDFLALLEMDFDDLAIDARLDDHR